MAEWKLKNVRRLEQLVRGFSNYRRIEIVELLAQEPELSIGDICRRLHMNVKTASGHLRRLTIAGMVMKRYEGLYVRHALTSRGKNILKFLRTLE